MTSDTSRLRNLLDKRIDEAERLPQEIKKFSPTLSFRNWSLWEVSDLLKPRFDGKLFER